LLLVLLKMVYDAAARWQQNRYRREAIAELARHEENLRDAARRATALVAVAELLKRTAITAFPREQVAGLTGAAWFAFLDRTGPVPPSIHASVAPSSMGTCAALAEGAAYDSVGATRVDDAKVVEIFDVVRHWLTHHHLESAGGGRRRD
jgi:hypothetical protein